jgi:hypothetical protein
MNNNYQIGLKAHLFFLMVFFFQQTSSLSTLNWTSIGFAYMRCINHSTHPGTAIRYHVLRALSSSVRTTISSIIKSRYWIRSHAKLAYTRAGAGE